ncbi:hypothetical protein [Methylosinus sp. RM1]|uniref:hypothetical protein n=1 Tax=Methylosinus sp. RM1 TaxID=2583817 RepID=UPI0014093805|nr:hypothetical protein [Methylosinus sp. RM1]
MSDVATHLHFVDGEDAQGLALGLPEPDAETTPSKPASEQDGGSVKKTLAATIATGFARMRTEFLGARRKPIDAAAKEERPFSETGAGADVDPNAPRVAEADPAPRAAEKKSRTNAFDPFDRYKLATSVSLAALGVATIAAVALLPNSGAFEGGVMEKGGDAGLIAPASKLASVPPNERGAPTLEIPAAAPPQKIAEEVQAFWSPEREKDRESRKTPSGPLAVAAPAAASPVVVGEVGVRPAPPAAPEGPKAAPVVAAKSTAAPPPALPVSVAAPVATAAPATASEAPAKAREEGVKRVASLPPDAPIKAEEKQLEMETRLFGMITELSTLLRRTREEIATLQDSDKRTARAIEAKLNDFERRLNLGEAQRSLDAAKATPTSPPEPASPPPAARPATGMKGVVPASLSTQSGADATMPPARYRVQAASPGLAMLAELDRSGDEIAPLQIGIGAHVPGYGRVTKISQRGTEWVVQTEKGPIR